MIGLKRALPLFLLSAMMLMFGCSLLPGGNPPPVNQTNGTFACPDGTNVTDLALCPQIPACPDSCDDSNACTFDYCGEQTKYACFRVPENSGQSGCSGPVGSTGYVSIKYGYSVTPPAGWRVDDTETGSLGLASFKGPQDESGFVPGFEISYSSVLPNETLDSLADSAKSSMSLAYANFTLLSDSEELVSGLPARRLVYAYVSESLNLVGDKYVLLDQRRASFALSYSSANRSFDRYRKAFETSVSTLLLFDYSSVCTAQTCTQGLCTEYGLCEGCTEDCNDGNPCTYDYCDVTSGLNCRHLVMGGPQPGCSGEPGTSAYANVEQGYSVSVPEGWKTSYEGGVATFSAPPSAREFATSFSIAIEKLAYDYPLDLYASEKISGLKNSLSDFGIVSQENSTFRAIRATRVTYEFSLGGMGLKAAKLMFIRNSTAYILTYTSVPKYFEDYLPIFNAAAASFDFAKPPSSCASQTCETGSCIMQELSKCCGNGKCEDGEKCATCQADCGVCIVLPQLDAYVHFLDGEAREFETINCFDFKVRIRIRNPYGEVMAVNATSPDVVELKTDAGSNCMVRPLETLDCYALVSGAFGERNQENTKEFGIGLKAYVGRETAQSVYYYSTINFDATNKIMYAGSDCSHFWCIPGNNATFGKNNFTVTGMALYQGYQLCRSYRTLGGDKYAYYYFNQFLPEYCYEEWNEYGYPIASTQKCGCNQVKGTCA